MNATDLGKLDRDALIALILKQAAIIEELRVEIEALKRSHKRQAAPLSKGTRAKDLKQPGRKPGHGLFKTGEAPAPETVSAPPIDVPSVETECPKCGGELDEGRVEEASITDQPEVVRTRMRLFRVHVRRCKRCNLKQAVAMGRKRRAGPVATDFAERLRRLKSTLRTHLHARSISDRDNQRLLNELGRYHGAGSLIQVLDDPRSSRLTTAPSERCGHR